MLPFSIEDLQAAVKDGSVTARPHPTLPLTIYNYSPSVQYKQNWDDVTLNCRGLILDADYNIVARPWKKFFNLGQVNLPIQFDTPVEVMDKADGSLGILYPTPDGFAIATRGSFMSEQAIEGTKIWQEKYAARLSEYETGLYGYSRFAERVRQFTYLFEIVYPANRIVLDYGDQRDLILLGAVENATGYYISPNVAAAMIVWDGPVVETYSYKSISEALANMGRKNREGYVIRSHNFLVKVKEPDYIDLHRLVTNASPKTVWEQLKQGKSKSEIVSAFPDEFHAYIGGMIDPLVAKFDERFDKILKVYSVACQEASASKANSVDLNVTRADYARVFKKFKDASYFFALLDNRSIRDMLWSELRPSATD